MLLYRRLNEIETTSCVYWYGGKYKNLKLTRWLQLTYLHLCAGGSWPASACTISTLFKACSFFKKFIKLQKYGWCSTYRNYIHWYHTCDLSRFLPRSFLLCYVLNHNNIFTFESFKKEIKKQMKVPW